MLGTFHLIRDLAIAFLVVLIAAVTTWIAIDYGDGVEKHFTSLPWRAV